MLINGFPLASIQIFLCNPRLKFGSTYEAIGDQPQFFLNSNLNSLKSNSTILVISVADAMYKLCYADAE